VIAVGRVERSETQRPWLGWVAGRITVSLLPVGPVAPAQGDAALFARIRQRVIHVAIFGLIAAALPTLVTLVVGIG